MSALDKIKSRSGLKKLKRELTHSKDRKPVAKNLKKLSSVAFVVKVDDGKTLESLTKVIRYFKSEFGIKEVVGLGYVNEKELPKYLEPSAVVSFICNADLSWGYVPNGNTYHNFTDRNFDVLISLDNDLSIPEKFVVVQSKANFKVGAYSEENVELFDLMLKVKEGDLEEYINQVVHYLNMINP